MKPKLLSMITCIAIIFTMLPATSIQAIDSSDLSIESPLEKATGNYVEGQVLVTTISENDTALTKIGDTPYDDIEVKKTWDFGEATFLADSDSTKDFLEEKDFHVSVVSSQKYSTQELMDYLSHKSYVTHVEPDYIQTTQSLTNDPMIEKQWYLSSNAVSVHAETSWSKPSNSKPIVAVLDTGVNYQHPDLASQMWVNPYTNQGLPGTYGYDYGDSDADPMDTDGHGTHCAGIIAASTNNQTGIAGIATNAQIMALKVFDSSDKSSSSYIIGALYYLSNAMTYGANVVAVNCSWGGSNKSSKTLSECILKIGAQGALFSFAAGNDGRNVETGTLYMPYDLDNTYVIPVGALTNEDKPASYSSYGANKVTIFAPGDKILSTVAKDTLVPNLLTESQRSQLLSYYDTCDTAEHKNDIHSATELGLQPSGYTDSIEYVSDLDAFNSQNGGSYRWTVTNTSSLSKNIYYYIDVTNLELNPLRTYYVSSMLGLASSSSDAEWEHAVMTSELRSTRFKAVNGKTYFQVLGVSLPAGTSKTLYVDEIAITTANPDTSQFGAYDYYSGTSMAAPMVSGAIAALAQAYPNDCISERKARLLASTRTNQNLIGKCSTISALDLSKMDSFISVSGLTISSPPKSCKAKKSIYLKATIAPANVTIPDVYWNVSNSKYASISDNGKFTAKADGVNHTVTVTAVSKSNSQYTASAKIKITSQKVSKLKLSKKNITLKKGKKKKLKVTISPSNATNKKMKWSSSNKKYATVSSSGVVRAKRAGKKVKITVSAKDGSGKKAVCLVKTIK